MRKMIMCILLSCWCLATFADEINPFVRPDLVEAGYDYLQGKRNAAELISYISKLKKESLLSSDEINYIVDVTQKAPQAEQKQLCLTSSAPLCSSVQNYNWQKEVSNMDIAFDDYSFDSASITRHQNKTYWWLAAGLGLIAGGIFLKDKEIQLSR
jgi:hypothetical protein